MNLQVSGIYQPDADEVLVEFSSTLDDLTTLSIADKVTANLSVGTQNLNGAWAYNPLAQIVVTPQYLLPTQNYEFKFRHPNRRADLFLEILAVYGVQTFTKKVQVGLAGEPQTEMSLPDNALFESDPFAGALANENFEAPNPNQIVLLPELQNYSQSFDFTLPLDPQEFEPLTYLGGGNRLLMNNQNNSFLRQTLDTAPWKLSSFAFLEPAGHNLIPNSFFNVLTGSAPYGQIPTGFTIDPAGALLTQTVAADYTTATGARLWTIRLRQNNSIAPFNQAVVALSAALPVTGSQAYCFSTYAKVQLMTTDTVVNHLTMVIRWFNSGMVFLSESTAPLPVSGFSSIALAQVTAQSPAGAAFAEPNIRLSSIDPGDDVALTLFGPQLETGSSPTSRTEGARALDQVTIPSYNAANQKIRMVFVPGFGVSEILSRLTPLLLTSGPIVLSLETDGTFKASIPTYGSVSSAPLSFATGDTLDFTIQHISNSAITLFLNGVQIATQVLPVVPPTALPLTLLGFGGELLHLTVFSRK